MPVGLDEALGVTALSLTLFHGCIKGLTILSKAKSARYDRGVSSVRLQIELEQHKLFTWAETAGLTQKVPTLYMSVNDAGFVPEILNHLNLLLSDITRLKKRYPGLDLHKTSENVDALDDDDATLSKLGPKLRAYTRRTSLAVFLHRTNAWKRLRWGAFDEEEVGKLLGEVKGYTAKLESFLDPLRRDAWRRDRDADLRDAILNSDDHQTLEIIGRESQQTSPEAALVAVTRLKQIRLTAERSEASPPSPSRPTGSPRGSSSDQKRASHLPSIRKSPANSLRSMRLHISRLTLSRAFRTPGVRRMLTYYDGKVVMLEWKNGNRSDSTVLERRIDGVATFLNRLEPSLHSLACQGYVRDEEYNRYGYVFDVPAQFQPPQTSSQSRRSISDLPDLQTLRGLFDQSDAVPSLDQRFRIAVTLLETLLNLHTSGWLHKQLRSDNIVFIRGNSTSDPKDFDIANYSMYIAGYGYARADEPGEMTEPLTLETEANLYRHPTSLGPPQPSFCRSFDIFSVGCTLLEIGLWSSLRQILFQHASPGLPGSGVGSLRYRTFQASSISRATSSTALDDFDDEKGSFMIGRRRSSSIEPSLDLMRLRHELLLSQLVGSDESDRESVSKKDGLTHQYRCKIFQSLAAATGNTYTRIVERLLSSDNTSETGNDTSGEEKERALVLEIEAVNTMQALKKAIG